MAYKMIAYSNEVGFYNCSLHILCFNSKATPTNDTDYSYHVNVAESV